MNSITTCTAYFNQLNNRIEFTWGEHVSDNGCQGGEKRSQEHANCSNIDCQVKERLEIKR
jgi:hypothetical protein